MAKNSAIPKQDFFNLYLELVDTIVEVIFVLPQSQDQECRSLQFLPAYNCTVVAECTCRLSLFSRFYKWLFQYMDKEDHFSWWPVGRTPLWFEYCIPIEIIYSWVEKLKLDHIGVLGLTAIHSFKSGISWTASTNSRHFGNGLSRSGMAAAHEVR